MTGPQGMGPLPPFLMRAGHLYTAIKTVGMDSYWPCRETSGTTFVDEGSLLNNATQHAMALATQDGPALDGFSYPIIDTGNYAGAPDNDAYSTTFASGLTIGCMFSLSSLSAGSALICKYGNSGSREWQVEVENDGRIFARLVTATGSTARQLISSVGTIVINTWYLVIVQFGPTNTSFPTIRLRGTEIAGTTSGTGTGGANAATPIAFGGRSAAASTSPVIGTICHVFTKGGIMPEADYLLIEEGAVADGWYIAPTVTVERHPDDPDPTTAVPVRFVVQFSEAVTGFGMGDVTITGTAGARTGLVSGSGSTYTVEVWDMIEDGTVICDVLAGRATNADGIGNVRSTSIDNEVNWSGYSPLGGIAWHSVYWAQTIEVGNGQEVLRWIDTNRPGDALCDLVALTNSAPKLEDVDTSFNDKRTVLWIDDNANNKRLSNLTANHPSSDAQPFTIVAIAKFDDLTGHNTPTMFDGGGTSNRHMLRLRDSGANYGIHAGGTERAGGTPDTNPHCFLTYWNGASSRLEVDGVAEISGAGSPGTDQHDGLLLGYNAEGSTTSHRLNGRIAFVGIYFGDVESDSGWSDFKDWVDDFYGITVA